MIQTIAGFESAWAFESAATLRLLNNLTTESLRQRVADDHRTLGILAWHLVVTIPEMMNRTGLGVAGPPEDAPLPSRASDIADAYRDAAASLADRVRSKWTDAELQVEDEMYGEKWETRPDAPHSHGSSDPSPGADDGANTAGQPGHTGHLPPVRRG